ncbi:Hypothetical protein NTJ_00961 [Nesidiocoris tenuis]|uniref:Uncharacterized protein n=1 Tax=Nesidiocoris tenuis TaxID=355587 RepID=A0ABN7ABE3_9HEMI|nr:Hypothetical protein NTJ_00961 [Nesidiocoris tenuis]
MGPPPANLSPRRRRTFIRFRKPKVEDAGRKSAFNPITGDKRTGRASEKEDGKRRGPDREKEWEDVSIVDVYYERRCRPSADSPNG